MIKVNSIDEMSLKLMLTTKIISTTVSIFAALLLSFTCYARGAQPRLPDAVELVGQSEFVGFVQVTFMVSDPQSEWKQDIYLHSVDPLKGSLLRDGSTKQFPWIRTDHVGSPGYPTWFGEKGEYLVFLRPEIKEGRTVWNTMAAFSVEYRPNEVGQIVGMVIGNKSEGQAISVEKLRMLLQNIIANKHDTANAKQLLNSLFSTFSLVRNSISARMPMTFEQRFEQAKQLALAIKIGTTRGDIEKIFPEQDGGTNGPESTRYYLT